MGRVSVQKKYLKVKRAGGKVGCNSGLATLVEEGFIIFLISLELSRGFWKMIHQMKLMFFITL